MGPIRDFARNPIEANSLPVSQWVHRCAERRAIQYLVAAVVIMLPVLLPNEMLLGRSEPELE